MVLTISPLSWAAETYLVDDFPEPKIYLPKLDTPEERITREVQAAIAKEKSQPIRDKEGRIHYIIDLVDEVDQGYSEQPLTNTEWGDWQKPSMARVMREFETQYKFKTTSLFSWVGKGFTAYLTPQQLQTLQKNPKVQQITEDHLLEFSASFTFVDEQPSPPILETPDNNPLLAAEQSLTTECSPSAECFPWNIEAVGGGKPSNGSVPIFVLDAGVGYHQDLPNVTERYSGQKIRRFSPVISYGYPVVGCYPHATHVTGILSAPHNGIGTIGVYSSAPITSIATTSKSVPESTACATALNDTSDIIAGLNQIRYTFLSRRIGYPGIINISTNRGLNTPINSFASTNSVGKKLTFLAKPAFLYSGAFIAQSAGNLADDACNFAYDRDGNIDGIMVVGAIDRNGQPVIPLNKLNGFSGNPSPFLSQSGSNYGKCVDIWAPGNKIYSTFADYPQSGDAAKPYDQYALLSGTSMAAPHVAGVAAWLAESNNLKTPAEIEAAVRSHAYKNGAKDTRNNRATSLKSTAESC